MALNDLKVLLHSNKKWEGNASGLGNALVKTMECTLNTLLPRAAMNPNPALNLGIGLVNSAPGLAGVQPWPDNAVGRVWHWPLVVQMEVESDDGTGPKMEEQIVRISLIQRETGGWFVMKEAVEALLTLWLFTMKERRLEFIKPQGHGYVKMQPFVRLIGSNTELTRWDIMRWYVGNCSQVYEGTPMTSTEASNNEKQTNEIDIEMGHSVGQVMGIEQVDLRSEDELAKEWEGVQQTPIPHRATMHWHYFRGRELPQVWYEDWPSSRHERYTSLVTTVECTLEEFCAQEILFRFFFAIGTFMREERGIRVLGNTTFSYWNTNSRPLDAKNTAPEKLLKATKFDNSILERIALEAYQSKVCGSLEEAYQCIIPAFSQARVLPEVGEVVSSQVTQIFRELVGKGDWIKACDLYNWVSNSMGFKFPHNSNQDLHDIILFTNFLRKLQQEANTGGTLTNQLAARGEEILKIITEQGFTEQGFQGRDVVQALELMLESLDELDNPIQGGIVGDELTGDDTSTIPTNRRNSQEESAGHGAPEGSGEGSPTTVRPRGSANGGVCKPNLEEFKEEVEKLLPLLGFTPSHESAAGVLGTGALVGADLERGANTPDVLQRRPLHYAAANPTLDRSILEILIRKTNGVNQRDINGNTPLHLAASRNNPKFTAVLRELSLEGDPEMRKKAMVDFNATNGLKRTPLHLAAYKGHQDMVDELIEEGAIIGARDITNRSPLHWAAQGGHLGVVKALIQKGANTKALDAYGRSPLHVAASIANGEVVAELAAHGARLEDVDREGMRALDLVIELLENKQDKKEAWSDLALREGEKTTERFRFLLDTLLISKEKRAKGWTALHCAAHRGEAQAVAALLDLDAKQNASPDTGKRTSNQTDHDQETALHIAARGGHLGVVNILILDKHKCNLRINNRSGEDALMVAVKNKETGVVNVLLEAFQKRTQDICQPVGGGTSLDAMYPLHQAAWHGSLDLVIILIHRGNVDLHQRDRVGMAAIHYAALMGHYRIVEWLLEQSPDLIEAVDKDGDTPLHYAAVGGRVQMVQLLLERYPGHSESDPKFINFVNRTNKQLETPLLCAVKGLTNAGIEKLVLAYKGVPLDTSMWGNLDIATTDWQRALISRICACFPREYLRNITAEDCESLNQGIRNWQEEFVRLLLRIGLGYDALGDKIDNNGETLLHYAAKGLINADIKKLDPSVWKHLDLATTDWLKALVSRICAYFPQEYLSNIAAEDCKSLNQGMRDWQEELVKLLLSIDLGYDALVNEVNHGEAPLHYTAKGSINAGIKKPGRSVWKSLDLATTDWQKALIRRICACFPREWCLNKITAEDYKSLNQGMRNWQEELMSLLLRKEAGGIAPPASEECERKVVELLLDNRANIEATDKDGETPLHLAAKWGRLTITKILLKHLPLPPDQPSERWEKANVCAEDIHKDTTLHLDEAPNTLTEFDPLGSLAVPVVPHIPHKDSGVGTDPSSRA